MARTIAPDLASLPDDVLLSRKQLAAITGFSIPAFKLWAKHGRGPSVTRIEGMPRYRAADVRAWLAAGSRPISEASAALGAA